MGGQNMGLTHGVFCVLTRWKALTPALRATPLPRAGEGPGVRAFGALQGQKTAKHSNVLSALKPPRERGLG
jgi:hypothetical protein